MTILTYKTKVHSAIVNLIAEKQFSNDEIKNLVLSQVEDNYPLLSLQNKHELTKDILHDVTGYGFLENYLYDEAINEIMINSTSCGYIDRQGQFYRIDINTSEEELTRLIQKIASVSGTRCDGASPIMDAWLADGSRVHAVLRPIAADGPYLTIRKFISRSFSLSQFCETQSQQELVRDLINKSKNIVVAGGTSTGKTTLLNCMLHKVDHQQRVVSIEETAELHCDHPHWLRLVARGANSEGAGKIGLGDLVKASLRMRPDRIVVGEVRSAEAFDLVQALNTGHDGSLCTIHANRAEEVIHRMASLALFAHPGLDYSAILTQVSYGIDAIIYVARKQSGKRFIKSISLVSLHDGRTQIQDIISGDKSYV